MAEARFTPRAEQQIRDIWRHIAGDSRRAADGLLAQVRGKIAVAADNPAIGAMRPELGDGRRVLVVGSYLVVYEPHPDGILILTIVHGMREPKSWLD